MSARTAGAGIDGIRIAELPAGDAGWQLALPVLQELRPHLTQQALSDLLDRSAGQGPRFLGAFDGPGRCLGVAGWRVMDNTSAGRKLYVDDLVTTASARSGGVGALLLSHLKRLGQCAGCHLIELDSGAARFDAHRFYLRERFTITAHHFSAPL